MADPSYTLAQLNDLENIRVLKHRYFRAIDTANSDLLADMFTDDLTVDYRGGTYRARFTGRENMLEFLANAFHSNALAMHHGHMPEITLTGEDTAEGVWYLEDTFINLEAKSRVSGTALYFDRYERHGGCWKIAHTEYERLVETVEPIPETLQITSHYLARAGRKPAERKDVSHLLQWD